MIILENLQIFLTLYVTKLKKGVGDSILKDKVEPARIGPFCREGTGRKYILKYTFLFFPARAWCLGFRLHSGKLFGKIGSLLVRVIGIGILKIPMPVSD